MPIKRHVLWRANVREVRVCENVKRRRKRSCCHGQQPCCHMQQGVWAGSWVILLHVFIVTFSLSLIKWTLSRGCRRFAEPRKILCQCALASYEQISVHPRSVHGVPEFPNTAQSHALPNPGNSTPRTHSVRNILDGNKYGVDL